MDYGWQQPAMGLSPSLEEQKQQPQSGVVETTGVPQGLNQNEIGMLQRENHMLKQLLSKFLQDTKPLVTHSDG